MRFIYEYRTSDNVPHGGEIRAANREAAYAQLKRQGIRPSRFTEAPGLVNKVFGKGKRWMVIGVLGAWCLVLGTVVYTQRTNPPAPRANPPAPITGRLPRHQVADLPPDWTQSVNAIFDDELDRLLAIHSQPGVKVAPASAGNRPAEGEWVAVMRNVVAGMRDEAKGFLALGKTMKDLELYLDERQQMEADYRDQVLRKYRSNALDRETANEILSAMSLETIR